MQLQHIHWQACPVQPFQQRYRNQHRPYSDKPGILLVIACTDCTSLSAYGSASASRYRCLSGTQSPTWTSGPQRTPSRPEDPQFLPALSDFHPSRRTPAQVTWQWQPACLQRIEVFMVIDTAAHTCRNMVIQRAQTPALALASWIVTDNLSVIHQPANTAYVYNRGKMRSGIGGLKPLRWTWAQASP